MNSEGCSILVVDDTPITTRWVGHVVERLGFNAVLAFNGQEAMSCLAERSFAAVISDVDMPGINGFELLQNIRQSYPDMPVILMSAIWNKEWREAALTYGAQATLQKPVSAEQLIELFGGRPPAHYESPAAPTPVLSVA